MPGSVQNSRASSTVLIVQCFVCRKWLEVKSAEGAKGGLSHGLCEGCVEDWIRGKAEFKREMEVSEK